MREIDEISDREKNKVEDTSEKIEKKRISKAKIYRDKLFIFFHFYYPSLCHDFHR